MVPSGSFKFSLESSLEFSLESFLESSLVFSLKFSLKSFLGQVEAKHHRTTFETNFEKKTCAESLGCC